MARFTSIQTNFSSGELDPLLRARVDLQAYSNALEEATNVVVIRKSFGPRVQEKGWAERERWQRAGS